jgi:hypothetical protein
MTIYERINSLTVWCVICFLFSCSSVDNNNYASQLYWDFDHKLQFRKTQIDKNNYHLEIIPNDNVKFNGLATLLIRYSYKICGGYHYQIKVLAGVEDFTDIKSRPNYIQRTLIADVKCSTIENN